MKSIYDLASYAEKFGYSYNHVIGMMEESGLVPFYERKTIAIYKGVGNDYGWDKDLCFIFDEYVKEHGNEELTD